MTPLLFAKAKRLARARDAAALFCLTLNTKGAVGLRALGFVRADRDPDDGTRFMVAVARPGTIRDLVGDPMHWFLTAADSDIDHPTQARSLP
jgi:hypothetical protein